MTGASCASQSSGKSAGAPSSYRLNSFLLLGSSGSHTFLNPWVWPDAPWTHIYVTYARSFLGKRFFIVVDAHSKRPEVLIMNSATSQSTVEALCTLFGRYGLAKQLVFDNGSQFVSSDFVHLLRSD